MVRSMVSLIVAPKGVYKNWYDQEIPNHMVNHIEKKCCVMAG